MLCFQWYRSVNRYLQWLKGKVNPTEWGAYDVFDKVQQRERLIHALAFLRCSNERENAEWRTRAQRDDPFAFDWLVADDAVHFVQPKFQAEFKMWRAQIKSGSRTGVVEWKSIPESVYRQLERLGGDDARSIGMNFNDAEDALKERWFQEANDFHPDARRCFNRIRIYQGAGRHARDDRIFLKVMQSRVLEKGSVSAGLLEELQWIAPSYLFERDSFSCLVDTPGLDDTDPFRISQTRAAISSSNTVLMFSQVVLNHLQHHGRSFCCIIFLSSFSFWYSSSL